MKRQHGVTSCPSTTMHTSMYSCIMMSGLHVTSSLLPYLDVLAGCLGAQLNTASVSAMT